MLTRIYIDNFRCFVNFEYTPESKQLLLGANGTGKSSLLDAITFLKQFAKGDKNPFISSSRTRWLDRPLQVFEIDTVLDKQKYEYRVAIRFARSTTSGDIASSKLTISQEQLKVSGKTVFELSKGRIHFFQNSGGQATTVPLEMTKSALHLSQLSNPHVRRFVEWLDSVHCFRIDVYPEAMEESTDREAREPDAELQNLADWYRYLVQADPEANVRFLNSMQEVLPGFQTLRFSSDEDGNRRLRADFAGPRKQKLNFAISELSDGQRYLLALYMVLHFLIARGSTVFIDEPDNFVALREIQPWLLTAEEAAEEYGGQLILISHHPEILNRWASRQGLYFFREENGQVRTKKFKLVSPGTLEPSELIARGWENE